MARPKREPDGRLNTSIRFDPALHERLLSEATVRQVSVNWMVTRLVAEGLDRLIPVEEMRLTRPPATCGQPLAPTAVSGSNEADS